MVGVRLWLVGCLVAWPVGGTKVLCAKWNGSILRQELALDLTSTSRYEDTKKDSIWIRPVSRNIEKCSHFKRNSKVDPGRMVGFPPLEL